MKYHPAVFMVMIWGAALLAFLALPFELTFRSISLEGMIVLIIFILVFCLGALLRTAYTPQHPVTPPDDLRTKKADIMLKVLASIACLTMGYEALTGGALNLGAAYSQRSDQAQALLHGGLSQSSSIFKIGFLCYPASYVYLARAIILKRKPSILAIIVFGMLPGVLTGLAMGGRSPMVSTIAYAYLAYRTRLVIFPPKDRSDMPRARRIHPLIKVAAVGMMFIAFQYFVQVFIARAEVVGGADVMLGIVATQWGVTFSGPGAVAMIDIIGPVATYLVFVFVWYLIQGIVMSNALFTAYDGEPLFGVYGIDIMSAVMRRVDPVGVSDKFNYLLGLETYGFLPSAFGTLFVDFLYVGIILAGVWGWLAAVVYRNIRRGRDPRWFLFAPFITFGILFSLVNTPLGFSNGFVTHFWMVVTFMLMRPPRRKASFRSLKPSTAPKSGPTKVS